MMQHALTRVDARSEKAAQRPEMPRESNFKQVVVVAGANIGGTAPKSQAVKKLLPEIRSLFFTRRVLKLM